MEILTHKQKTLWNDPRLSELRKRLDLQPIQSPEVRLSIQVSTRIDEYFKDFSNPAYKPPPKVIRYQAPNGIWHESPF